MERRGIPHLAKNERDVGHPRFVVRRVFRSRASGYFRMKAKITTRIRTTRRKALSTSRIGSISCSLVRGAGTAGAANAGGANLGATTLGGSIAGA